MSLSATLKMDGASQGVVRYVDSYGGGDAFLADVVIIKAAELPDPPPALLRISVSWSQASGAAGAASTGAEGAAGVTPSQRAKLAQGDRVDVIKSRVSGVKNPPEWLEQYVGRSGVVLWTTADGAMVDLDADTTWFSFDELKPKD